MASKQVLVINEIEFGRTTKHNCGVERISKTEVRRVFREKSVTIREKCDWCAPRKHVYDVVWRKSGAVVVGCKTFTKHQVEQIRKWAGAE